MWRSVFSVNKGVVVQEVFESTGAISNTLAGETAPVRDRGEDERDTGVTGQ